jgi:hypothetical protein
MTHYAKAGKGECTPRESEVKTERTPVLNVLPAPHIDLGLRCFFQRLMLIKNLNNEVLNTFLPPFMDYHFIASISLPKKF